MASYQPKSRSTGPKNLPGKLRKPGGRSKMPSGLAPRSKQPQSFQPRSAMGRTQP